VFNVERRTIPTLPVKFIMIIKLTLEDERCEHGEYQIKITDEQQADWFFNEICTLMESKESELERDRKAGR